MVPKAVQEIRSRSSEVGMLHTVHEVFERDGISVEITGDSERLLHHDGGILFVGDHQYQWEFAAAMDCLAQMGRTDMLNVAKFYVERQLRWALGEIASQHIVPVYPRILAKDRGEFWNSETLNRIAYRKHLLPKEESAKRNDFAIATAIDRLRQGGVVNIFPCGSIVNAMTHPWRKGVGRIIDGLEEDAAAKTLTVPYKLSNFSRMRFLSALLLRGKWPAPKEQTMHLQLGMLQTAAEIKQAVAGVSSDTALAVTEHLQRGFISYFS